MSTTDQDAATAEALTKYGHMTVQDLQREMERTMTETVLNSLEHVPHLVKVTFRHQLGDTCWDVTIEADYFTDPEGREQRSAYSWEAEETKIGHDDDFWPEHEMAATWFSTAREALDDALRRLPAVQSGTTQRLFAEQEARRTEEQQS